MGIIIVNIFSIIAQAIASTYVILLIYNKITNLTPSKKQKITLLTGKLLIFLIATVTKMFFPGLNTVLSIIIETLLIMIILKVKIIKSLLIVIGNMCIFAITEIVSVYTLIFVTHTSMENAVNSTPKFLFVNVFQLLIVSILIYIYYKTTKKKPINFEFLKNINNKQLLLFTFLLIIYIFPQMFMFISKSYTYPVSLLVVNSIQFVLMFVIAFVLVKNIVVSQKAKTDLFVSEVHNKTLVGLVDGVRTMKHDYNNIMQSLNGYCLTKQYDKLQNHIGLLLKECKTINNYDLINPDIINDPAMYGIIGSKYLLANEKNINFDLEIVSDISAIDFPKAYLSRILGILLDNALEASQKTNEPYVRLEMRYDLRKNADVIRIINTYDTSINIDITEIFKKGFSTKEVKSGIGLWEVNKIVKQQKNSQIFASIEGKYFVQTLIIEHNENYKENLVLCQ